MEHGRKKGLLVVRWLAAVLCCMHLSGGWVAGPIERTRGRKAKKEQSSGLFARTLLVHCHQAKQHV